MGSNSSGEYLFIFWPDFLACPGSPEERLGWKGASEEGVATALVQNGSPELADAVTEAEDGIGGHPGGLWEAREQ